MNSFVLAIRAIGAAFAMRLFIPVAILASLLFIVLFSGGLWLTTFSSWWWLLLIPITSLFCIALAILFVAFSLLRYVRPEQTKAQKQAVGAFINRLQNVAELAATPKLVILFHVVRSVATPSSDSYLSDLVQNKELVKDFKMIQRSFGDEVVLL